MGDTLPDIPLMVRSHEIEQLHEWVPKVVSRLEDIDMEDRAGEVELLYENHIADTESTQSHSVSDGYITMAAGDWRLLVRELRRISDEEGAVRTWWLRKKLVQRLSDRLEELE